MAFFLDAEGSSACEVSPRTVSAFLGGGVACVDEVQSAEGFPLGRTTHGKAVMSIHLNRHGRTELERQIEIPGGISLSQVQEHHVFVLKCGTPTRIIEPDPPCLAVI